MGVREYLRFFDLADLSSEKDEKTEEKANFFTFSLTPHRLQPSTRRNHRFSPGGGSVSLIVRVDDVLPDLEERENGSILGR